MKHLTHTYVPFQKGEQVWLESTNLKMGYQEGPFKILEVLGPLTFKLKLLFQWRIHLVFHASLLTHYRQNNKHGPSFTNPPPDLEDDGEYYKVEAILAH